MASLLPASAPASVLPGGSSEKLPFKFRMRFRKWGRLPESGLPRVVHLSFQMIDLLAQPIVLSLEAIMPALRPVALARGAFRPFSQVFDLTSGPIVQGWVP